MSIWGSLSLFLSVSLHFHHSHSLANTQITLACIAIENYTHRNREIQSISKSGEDEHGRYKVNFNKVERTTGEPIELDVLLVLVHV